MGAARPLRRPDAHACRRYGRHLPAPLVVDARGGGGLPAGDSGRAAGRHRLVQPLRRRPPDHRDRGLQHPVLLRPGRTPDPRSARRQRQQRSLGIDPCVGQIVVSACLAAAVFPARNAVRRPVERLLFAERFALRTASIVFFARWSPARALQTSISRGARPTRRSAPSRTLRRLCARRAERRAAVQPARRGCDAGVAGDFADRPVALAMQGDGAPLDLQGRRRAGRGGATDAAAAAALEPLQASVVLPILRGRSMVAFFALGPKRSGDVYTETDLAFLGAVARHLSSEILRLEISSNVPRKVMDLLLRDPRELEPKTRHGDDPLLRWKLDSAGVTRDAAQSLQDRCMTALEKVVDRHSGILLNRLATRRWRSGMLRSLPRIMRRAVAKLRWSCATPRSPSKRREEKASPRGSASACTRARRRSATSVPASASPTTCAASV